jgi:hypothetical protein
MAILFVNDCCATSACQSVSTLNSPVGCDGNIFCLVAIFVVDGHLYIFSLIVRSPGLLECVALIEQRSVVRIFYLVWVEVCNCVSQLHTLLRCIYCLDLCLYVLMRPLIEMRGDGPKSRLWRISLFCIV